MKIFLLLINLFPVLCWATSKNIVFNLDGTLIQGIPASRFSSYTNKDQMFTVSIAGKPRYFYIIPFASQLVAALHSKQDISVHVVSKYSRQDTLAILSKIRIPKPLNDSFNKIFENGSSHVVLTQEDLVSGKIDLSKVSTDLKNTILFTGYPDIVLPTYKSNEVAAGKTYYYFETFEQAAAELASNPKLTGLIPSTKEEWSLDQGKLAYAWQILLKANFQSSEDLVSDINALKFNQADWTKDGLEWAYANFTEIVPKWVLSADRSTVLGCSEYSVIKKKFQKSLSFQECLDIYGTKFTFKTDENLRKVVGCEEKDEGTSAFIQKSQLSKCLDKNKDAVKFYWKGYKKEKCDSYFNELYFIQEEKAGNCGDNHAIEENGKIKFLSLFFDGTSYIEAIPGIMKLGVNQVVDNEVYKKFDSIAISQSLIKLIQQKRESNNKQVAEPAYDFYRDTRIVMAINFGLFKKIQDNGFLNQHMTKSSNGTLNPARRADAEDSFLGVKLEAKYDSVGKLVHKIRPKYSYLLLDAPHSGMGDTIVTNQYGNIFFKFKDSIKNRSTFTPGDSLTLNTLQVPYGGTFTFYYRSSKTMSMLETRYWEAQIWGELTLKDVDYVIVNCPGFATLSDADIEVFKQQDLDVYGCHLTRSNGSIVNVMKGGQL